MDYKEYTAKTVDEAITQACLELGVTSDRLEYDVVQEATSGFLGLGAKSAVIKARARSEEELEAEKIAIEKAEQTETPAFASGIVTSDEIEKRAAAAAARAKAEGTEGSAPVEREKRDRRGNGRRDRRDNCRGNRREYEGGREVKYEPHEPSKPKPDRVVKERTEEEAKVLTDAADAFLKSVFASMGITAEIKSEYDAKEGAVNCTFDGEEMGILIGKRGQTLDSLQYLTSLVVNKQTDEYVRVKLDTEDYRARRADTLENLARNIAYKVKRTRRPVALEPMNPYERRIIHSALQGNKFVETYSEGDEPYRHVVVTPKR